MKLNLKIKFNLMNKCEIHFKIIQVTKNDVKIRNANRIRLYQWNSQTELK